MKRILFSLLIGLTVTIFSYSHPHIHIDVKLTLIYEGTYCTGFYQEWTFDPIFSAELMAGWDKDKNRSFSASEQQSLYREAFSNLKHYGYYTLIRKGDKRITPDLVEQFSAWISNNRITYRFFVPLPQQTYSSDFSIAIFDVTYYSAIRYHDPVVQIIQKQEGQSVPSFTRTINRNFPVYYNPSGTRQDMTTYTKPGPGLVTAYPEEIVFIFNTRN
ncbi:MAG: DUF1007 family protein [Termitinemataceae bacterium]